MIFSPPEHIELYAICIDDTPPEKFTPENWIEKDKLYKVQYISDALNVSTTAVTIVDSKGKLVLPNETYSAFKIERFILFDIVLN